MCYHTQGHTNNFLAQHQVGNVVRVDWGYELSQRRGDPGLGELSSFWGVRQVARGKKKNRGLKMYHIYAGVQVRNSEAAEHIFTVM